MKKTKYIFVTGGVTSSLGKGIISSSLAKLLQGRGFSVTIQKLDPYINIDPGTLNPYEHGECFVTEDGAETDLDLGHYVEQIATDEALKEFNKALKEVVIFTDHTSSLFTSTGSVETIAVERSSGFTTYVKQDGCPVTYAEWLKTAWAKAIGAK